MSLNYLKPNIHGDFRAITIAALDLRFSQTASNELRWQLELVIVTN